MLAEAVREAARQVREAAQSANIDIRVEPNMPEVEVSAAVIELCVKNYLSNAIKYADPAKNRRTVEISGSIEESESTGREIVVRVCDNGIGVPLEKRDQLFERFFRAHEGTSKAEGTGLGLSIVRETAESQGGRAWAEYPEEGGTVFAISLPLHREPDAPETRRGTGPNPTQ
jgi:signal transduction histidine kinase